jgi:hypothetical protein
MEELKIEFQPNLKSKILDFLSTFSPEDVKISHIEFDKSFDPNFDENKKILDKALEKVNNGTAEYCTLDELDKYMDEIFAEHDNNIK